VTRAWWIDEAAVLAGSVPGEDEAARLRAEGFGLAVSLKHERKRLAGLSVYSIPIGEGHAPSLVQACEFAALMGAVASSTRSLVFCDNGLGRSSFMGAIYWIAKGLTVDDAVARVARSSGVAPVWPDGRWHDVLVGFERLGWRFP
jgi:hypothetical protein